MKTCYIFDSEENIDIQKEKLSKDNDIILLIEKFDKWDIDFLLNKLKKITDFHTIIIPCSLGNLHTKYFGILLGLHIRLTKELEEKRFSPIIFVSSDDYKIISLFDIENYFKLVHSKGCRLIKYSDLMDTERLKNHISKCSENGFDLNKSISELEEDLKETVLNNLNISMPYNKDSHSIANIWGINRMVFQLNSENTKEISDLYIKYLTSKTKSDEGSVKERDKTLKKWKNLIERKKINVLFIDNDANKGWNKLVKELFNIHNDIQYKQFTNSIDAQGCISELKITDDNFPDIILLDLRLENEDDKIILPKNISDYSGGKLLLDIKKRFPFIPVIIFTASNKAWNIEELLQNGADGYYIKESPEFGIDNKYSVETFRKFTENLKQIIEKAEHHKKIWIFNDKMITNLNESIINENIRESVKQKLKMAFAILYSAKTKFEIDNYVYNEFEFSFLSYWSILNEIVADKYKIDKNGKFKNNEFWRLIEEPNKIFFKDKKSMISYNYDRDSKDKNYSDKSVYFIGQNIMATNHSTSISLQIAGLVLLSNYYAKNDSEKDKFFGLLNETNRYRNKMDIIHISSENCKKETFEERRNSQLKNDKVNLEKIIKILYFLLNKEIITENIFKI